MQMNTSEKTNIRAFLDIRGFSGDPGTISNILGLKPDETWSKGDIIPVDEKRKKFLKVPHKIRRRKYSCWTINAKVKKPTYDVEVYIKNIIRKIKPAKDKILELPANVNIMLCVWIDIYCTDSTPAIPLSVETMKFLSDIRCFLDIDISMFCPED